jgi:hypothetical protein
MTRLRKGKAAVTQRLGWWSGAGSNRRPGDFQVQPECMHRRGAIRLGSPAARLVRSSSAECGWMVVVMAVQIGRGRDGPEDARPSLSRISCGCGPHLVNRGLACRSSGRSGSPWRWTIFHSPFSRR